MIGHIEVRTKYDVATVVIVTTGLSVLVSAAITFFATTSMAAGPRNTVLLLSICIPAVVASVGSTMLALALRQATRLKDDLERVAWLDELTGVFNRRAFFVEAERMLSLARRTRESASLVLMDIDRLRAVNEEFGRETGDEVIVGLARTAAKFVRASDIIARMGGDEFTILLYGAGLDEATSIAERIREAVAASPLVHVGDAFELTASIGVAQVEAGAGLTEAMRRADRALYLAKANGRNRVESEAKRLIVLPSERRGRIVA